MQISCKGLVKGCEEWRISEAWVPSDFYGVDVMDNRGGV
jgi:hypothetical protein